MSNIKRMDIAEFRRRGFLQEANRQFFHPHGLALEVTVEEDGEERLSGVWDYRDDPEGVVFGDGGGQDKAQEVMAERLRHTRARIKLFGLDPDYPHLLTGADVEPLGWLYPESLNIENEQ